MTVQEIFIGSEYALTTVVDQIKDNQWDMILPEDFKTRANTSITLREIINYHAYDDSWVPNTLAGKTIEQVGDTYAGDLLGDDPKDSWHKIIELSVDAVRRCDLERKVHLTYGDFSTREYLMHTTSFRVLRAVDIARAIGVNDRLPKSLAQAALELLLPDAELWRKMGVYGPAVPVAKGADAQAKLLGLTGRQP